MPFRVERLTRGDETTESPLALQQTGELFFDQRHSVAQGCDVGVLAGLDGALEAVDDVRKVKENLRVRVADGVVLFAMQPSAEILEVRLLAEQLILEGSDLRGQIAFRNGPVSYLPVRLAFAAVTAVGFPGRRRIGHRFIRPPGISRRWSSRVVPRPV